MKLQSWRLCVQSESLLGATFNLVVAKFDNLSKSIAAFQSTCQWQRHISLVVATFDNLSKAFVSLCQPDCDNI
jgi:hypothetical protein